MRLFVEQRVAIVVVGVVDVEGNAGIVEQRNEN